MEDILYSKYYSIIFKIFNKIWNQLPNVVPKKLNSKQKDLLTEFAEISGEEIKHVEKGLKDKFKDVFN